MTDCELDTLMQRILLDSLKLEWEKELEPEPSFVPSENYKRQIRAMLANPLVWARKKASPMWKKAVRWAAVVLLMISLGAGSLFAASPMVRAVVLQWITEWYETHITYRYAGADMAGTMPRYEITKLPEGYVEVEGERIEWPGQVDMVYRNERSGETIYLNYIQMSQGLASDFFVEGTEIVPVNVNGLDGQLFDGADMESERNTITWVDPNGDLQFSIDAPLGKTDILHIAESVSLVESTK